MREKVKEKRVQSKRTKYATIAQQKGITIKAYILQQLQADVNQAAKVLSECFSLIKNKHSQLFEKAQKEYEIAQKDVIEKK